MRHLHIAVLALAVFVCAASGAAHAIQPDEILPDPAMEDKARAISAELRCLVCQSQSIDDSDAPLARDLRLIVRERLKAGDDREQILNFMAERYGDFVLLRPRFSFRTLLLWMGTPLLALLVAALLFIHFWDRRRALQAEVPAPLSDAEKAKLAGILGEDQST